MRYSGFQMSLGSFENQNPKSSEGFEFFQFAYGKLKTAIVIFVAIDGDRFCQSFDGAVKGNDDGEFGVNDSAGKYGGYGFPCANA